MSGTDSYEIGSLLPWIQGKWEKPFVKFNEVYAHSETCARP